jgi:hypothetical protein
VLAVLGCTFTIERPPELRAQRRGHRSPPRKLCGGDVVWDRQLRTPRSMTAARLAANGGNP